jgi:LacI family transcriptional regulator
MSGALEQAILYFKRRGVRDICFIGESLTGSTLRGFRETMEKFSLEIDEGLIGLTEKRFSEGGYAAMSRMLDGGGRPRALICAYDSMAIGAMRCIRERGLRIPEDIALIGMDDIPVAKYLYPSLSSIDLKSEEIAASATMAIIGKILGKSYEIKPISATLNLRESSNL